MAYTLNKDSQTNTLIPSGSLKKKRRWGESIIQSLLLFAGLFSIFTTIGIVYELGKEAWLFFRLAEVNLWKFLTGIKWQPHIGEFGILPLATATLVTTAIAMLIAIPLGLAAAVYLSEYASKKTRNTIKPILEILAGIPTIVYGYFALTFVTPLLRSIFGSNIVEIYNTGSAGLVMGILILPLIASISEDALNAVPRSQREAAYGLGATKLEVAVKIVRTGSAVGDRRSDHPGHQPRHRRNDDRGSGSRSWPQFHTQPIQRRRNDDRSHCSHFGRRLELRLDRLQQHLCHRPDVVCFDADAEHRQPTHSKAFP